MRKKDLLEKKLLNLEEGVTFDDILILPGFTDFKRDEVDLSVSLHPQIRLKLPVISSSMDTVTESQAAVAMAEMGGLGVIHRNLSVSKQAQMVQEVKKTRVKDSEVAALDERGRLLVAAAVGVGPDFQERVKALASSEVDLIVVDSGHGFSSFVIQAVEWIKRNFPELVLMAGNVATYDGAKALIQAGADILRVGMGPGSICTTRIVTGMGVPQLTAVAKAVQAVEGSKVKVVADGGIREIGDIAKALAFGADAVMLGSLLAGFDESPGDLVEIDGKKYKEYRGMGSIKSMKKGAAERYGQKAEYSEKKLIAEGVEGLVAYRGSLRDFLFQIQGGLRSSFYYIGARDLPEFFEKSRFIKISRAGLFESHPHSVVIKDTGGSYKLKE